MADPRYESGANRPSLADENMLLTLQKSLPENYQIETCFFCRFSCYHPVGNDNFGALDCFKN